MGRIRAHICSASEPEAVHLAGRVAGQRVDELQGFGQLVAGQRAGPEVPQLLQRRRVGPVAWHHHRQADLAHDRIGASQHRGLQHPGMRLQDALDLHRVHVVAAPYEHLAGASGQPVQAPVVDRGQVAGSQPAVDEGLLAGGGVTPVARHHRGRAQPELAGLPGRERGAARVADLGLDPVAGPADRMAGLVIVGVEGGGQADAPGLGGGVADRVRGAEALAGGPHQIRSRGSAPGHHRPHRREVQPARQPMADHQGDLRGDAVHGGHAVTGGEFQSSPCRPALQQVRGPAPGQHPRELRHEPHVSERSG